MHLLKPNAHFLALVAIYVACAEALSLAYGFEHNVDLYKRMWMILTGIAFMAVVSVIVLASCWRHRPESPLRHARDVVLRDLRLKERAILALPVFLLFPLFIGSFTSVKAGIPDIAAYSFDPFFAEISLRLHGGRMEWEWLHPIIGFPLATTAINFAYNLWFFVMWVGLSFVAVWSCITTAPRRQSSALALWSLWPWSQPS